MNEKLLPNKSTIMDLEAPFLIKAIQNHTEIIRQCAIQSGGPYFQFEGDIYISSEIEESLRQLSLQDSLIKFLTEEYPKFLILPLTVRETDLESGHVLREGQTKALHHYREESVMRIFVRSDKEEYNYIDNNTFVIFPDSRSSSFFFLVKRPDMSWWLADLMSIISSFSSSSVAKIEDILSPYLKSGWLATKDSLNKLVDKIPINIKSSLSTAQKKYQHILLGDQINKSLMLFWSLSTSKIKIGAWKLQRGENNILSVSNGHITLTTYKTILPIKSLTCAQLEILSEEDMIKHLMYQDSSSDLFKQNDLTINGVPIEFDRKYYRPYLFGHPVKKSEILPILNSMSCMSTREQMEKLCLDCSVLSLQYRTWLNEGFRMSAKIEVSEKSMAQELGYDCGRVTYSRRAVKSYHRFYLERRGSRGLFLVSKVHKNNKGEFLKFPFSPSELSGRGYLQFNLQNALNCSPLESKKLCWEAFKNDRVRLKKSRQLLEEVAQELNATKELLNIEGRSLECYTIVGNSGSSYAIENVSGHSKIYRKASDGMWRYLCIETSSPSEEEVGADSLVTRIYALVNDTDSTEDIDTLKSDMKNNA